MKRIRFGRAGTVIALELVALSACLATPVLRADALRHKAERAVREVEQVRAAAASARAKQGEWPPEATPGQVPKGLRSFLPERFSFERDGYQLDWVHWQLRDDAEEFAPRHEFVGVSIVTQDAGLSSRVVEALKPGRMHVTLGDRVTVVIEAPEPAMAAER